MKTIVITGRTPEGVEQAVGWLRASPRKGKRLFRDESNATLKLVETQTFSSGVIALTYQTETKQIERTSDGQIPGRNETSTSIG